MSSEMVNAVRIGGVTARLRAGGPLTVEGYLASLSPELMETVRWLAQKDALGQDAVLLSSPADRPRARRAALAFAELINAEAYYVAVSSDTSEADLRQRRELTKTGASWSDAPPVKAALRGGVLILDGLERAERNVLPTLNNLLENREMTLDDGRTLMSSRRVAEMSIEERAKICAVSADFRVICLSSPVPPFAGRALDPPLRSRLQSRLLPRFNATSLMLPIQGKEAQRLISAALFLGEEEASALGSTSLQRVASSAAEGDTARSLLGRVYPPLLLDKNKNLDRILGRADIEEAEGFLRGGFYFTGKQQRVLADLKRDIDSGQHVLVLGRRGSGKSDLVKMLNGDGSTESMALHGEMTSRDLLQRRDTDEEGSSVWRDTALVRAVRSGETCVLEGLHRAPPGAAVAALGWLCSDGCLDLPDGTRLTAASSSIIVAIGESSPKMKWLTPELASLFSTHVWPEWEDEEDISQGLCELTPGLKERTALKLARLATLSRQEEDSLLRLSQRQLLRLGRRASTDSLHKLTRDALMWTFLPKRLQDSLDGWFDRGSIESEVPSLLRVDQDLRVVDAEGRILASLTKRPRGSAPELVPQPRPYVPSAAAENGVAELALLEAAGEKHVMVLGNQGVGKNVAVDRWLELSNAEREYAQLHRDSTLASLTTTPALINGRLVHLDAPLVKAALKGRVCVLDEADKAPLEVLLSLQGLVSDGELQLADGRLLRSTRTENDPPHVVLLHPDFRLVVLANRPGFPFHGNALFAECGEAFAALAMHNPDVASEEQLLEKTAPSLPAGTRSRLARAFAELRVRSDTGALSYPFSMRECLSVARHLEAYPDEGIGHALANVLAHDAYAPSRELVVDVFESHGLKGAKKALDIILGSSGDKKVVLIEYVVDKKQGGSSIPKTGLSEPKFGEVDPTGDPHVGGNTWAGGSGGSDTAGLGGRGGPYRLWDGKNPVHQVSDAAKAEVSEAALKQAKEQSRRAHLDRLKEIDKMSESDWEQYSEMLQRVQSHVASLKEALKMAQERSSERVWMRGCTEGELDEGRLVEGLAGEPNVFKKRGRPDDADFKGDEQGKRLPLRGRLLFLMDCSGSMYRFQMIDGRLQKMLEATMLLMEVLEGLDNNFEYAIKGHSGESDDIEFVKFGDPPANRGERFKVLQRMVAHSQFCTSGDTTVQATKRAIKEVQATKGDERLVVVALSDANFRRYGMDPAWWAEALIDEKVEAYAVMVGSIGDEAQRVCSALPRGRGHVCMDARDIPVVFKRILEHARVIDDGSSSSSSD